MTDREKIIEILRASGYGYFITHEITNADEALADTADALIAAEYGDVSEWKRRAEVAEKELEKHKRALSKVIKDRNVLAKEFYGTILQGEGQLYEDYYLGWVEHEMQRNGNERL